MKSRRASLARVLALACLSACVGQCKSDISAPAAKPTIAFPEFALPTASEFQATIHAAADNLPQVDVGAVLQTAHREGIVGLARRLLGKAPRESTAQLAWDAVGSKPETRVSRYGYSPQNVLKTGPFTKQVEADNIELTNVVLSTLKSEGWVEIADKDDIQVFKRSSKGINVGEYPPGVGAKKTDGGDKFMCLWARGVVQAPIDKTLHLFLSNDYVQEYNPMCQECHDIGWLNRATRLTWATSRRVGPISPRDFVTRCHYRKLRDGTLVVAQMSEQLPCDEFRAKGQSATYTRMEVLLCGYILRPIMDGAQTELNMLSLSNPGGIFDTQLGAATANFFAATGPVNVITAIRKLCRRDFDYALA